MGYKKVFNKLAKPCLYVKNRDERKKCGQQNKKKYRKPLSSMATFVLVWFHINILSNLVESRSFSSIGSWKYLLSNRGTDVPLSTSKQSISSVASGQSS